MVRIIRNNGTEQKKKKEKMNANKYRYDATNHNNTYDVNQSYLFENKR